LSVARTSASRRGWSLGLLGLACATFALYVLTNVGRIDIIDGQIRYDVAANWLDTGQPTVTDRFMMPTSLVLRPPHGAYGAYLAAPSVTPMPFMLLSRLLPGHTIERDRFAFTMAGPLFGAAGVAILVWLYGQLGFGLRTALAWAAAMALTTLWWPGSLTVFDQNQHGVFLLAAVALAWQAGRRASLGMAALGGVMGGVLLCYRETYALVLPFAALAVFASSEETQAGTTGLRTSVDRAGLVRYGMFGAGASLGVLAFVAFNYWRFGTALVPTVYDRTIIFGANTVAAILSLTVSPGKSMLLFSAPVILAVAGARSLVRRAPMLAAAVAGISLIHVMLTVQLTFFGGDWTWGPRYLVPLVPLWSIAAPFAVASLRRSLVTTVLAAGLIAQLLGISVDAQRFFFEHDLRPHFWEDQWAYFKRSQLFARPVELATIVTEGVPAEAKRFAPTPQGDITYTFAGPPNYQRPGRLWARDFAAFHLLRPWPAWVAWLEPARRPVDPWRLLGACVALAAAGGVMLALAVRRCPEDLQ
jgi:hypothetical protein